MLSVNKLLNCLKFMQDFTQIYVAHYKQSNVTDWLMLKDRQLINEELYRTSTHKDDDTFNFNDA